MAKIDLEKFICSLIKYYPPIPLSIKKALKDQGLEYKDGEIVGMEKEATEPKYYTSIDPHFGKPIDIPFGAYDSELIGNEYTVPEGCTAEVKDGKVIIQKEETKSLEIKAGHWYTCIVEGLAFFTLNNVYYCSKDGYLDQWGKGKTAKPIFINSDSLVKFRLSTEDEIPQEPKFKKDDWVVGKDNKIWNITRFDGKYYIVRGIDGEHRLFAIENQDDMRLWDISKDAKAGDVLVYSDSRQTWICIFKKRKGDRIYDYCSYNEDGDEIGFYPRSNWNYDKVLKYSPATKEQRNLLEFEMKEAGYLWDAEKKELKEIQKIDLGNTNDTNTIKFDEEPEKELTEFESELQKVLDQFITDGTKTSEEQTKIYAPILISLARKQIVENLNNMV